MVYAVLNLTVHEGREVIYGIIDSVVCDATLGVVVGAYLGAAVSCGNHGLALAGDIVEILLVFLVVNEGTQARKCPFLVLGSASDARHSRGSWAGHAFRYTR